MKLTLRQLRYALAVARHGGISAAAERLNVSQPAVSAAIGELEEILGQALFVRARGSGMTTTPFGRQALAQARRTMEAAMALEGLADGAASLAGELALGCFEDLAPYCLPPLLSALRERHPSLRVEPRECGFDLIGPQLLQGGLDAAISYDLALPPALALTELRTLAPHALLAADHPLARGEQVSLRELCEWPLLLTEQAYSGAHFLDLLRMHGLRPARLETVRSLELQRGMVAHGLGVAIAYTRPSGDHSYDGRPLALRPIADPLPTQRIVLACLRERTDTPAIAALRELAQGWFAARPEFGVGAPGNAG
ncbi:LysR family transcriptional regulator [Chromobacterium aquaticum]|uniref:LysR family transcriptional regulator n=1 Tax=Chromobacterium aquaticum TaxID=467180 RepID=A0ABV8ZXM1_9NEIS|nr:LysR family transcriptional regulator [Chromobacterium aquaticum]MCD5360222.1 LysR family transcriptional regulator [Chromobacterium aquaticum]